MPRRPPEPRPQSRRCRYVDAGRRCPSIAGRSGFCARCELLLENEMEPRSALDDLLKGLFGVGNVSARRTREAGIEVITETIRRRFPGLAGEQPGPGQPPGAQRPPHAAGPRGRVSPEAIAARKANLAARGVMGFEPDEPLTPEQIKRRRQELARVYHTDTAGGQPDPTREAMMRKINAAHDLLMAAAQRR